MELADVTHNRSGPIQATVLMTCSSFNGYKYRYHTASSPCSGPVNHIGRVAMIATIISLSGNLYVFMLQAVFWQSGIARYLMYVL
jgi:hypothetical protein